MSEVNLESVAEVLRVWRNGKRFKSEPMPDEVLDQIVSLLKRHKKSELVKVLKISSKTWNSRRFQKRVGDLPSVSAPIVEKPPKWIEVKQMTSGFALSKVHLRRDGGVELDIDVPREDILNIIDVFIKGGSRCSN
jgi:hypothetical protein